VFPTVVFSKPDGHATQLAGKLCAGLAATKPNCAGHAQESVSPDPVSSKTGKQSQLERASPGKDVAPMIEAHSLQLTEPAAAEKLPAAQAVQGRLTFCER
jgi:hypothetical protein